MTVVALSGTRSSELEVGGSDRAQAPARTRRPSTRTNPGLAVTVAPSRKYRLPGRVCLERTGSRQRQRF